MQAVGRARRVTQSVRKSARGSQMGNPKFTRRATLAGMMGGVAGLTIALPRQAWALGQPIASASDGVLTLEFDTGLHSRLSRRGQALTPLEPGEGVRLSDGRVLHRFTLLRPRAGADCAWRTLRPDRDCRRNAREASRGRVPRRLSRRRADDGALSQRRQAADRHRAGGGPPRTRFSPTRAAPGPSRARRIRTAATGCSA